jgi:hypothetical protein
MRTDVTEFLAKKAETSRIPRLVFAIDATASRERTWDTAAKITAAMFTVAAGVGGGLQVQLVYYRGTGHIAECRASAWTEPHKLSSMMARVRCVAGETQIGKVLTHVTKETKVLPVSALVFVGDAMEENPDELVAQATAMGVPAFMFQEGHDAAVECIFRTIVIATKGAYCRFDAGAARQLSELLRAVVAFVVGGTAALEQRKDAASIKLLGQLKKS